MKCCYSYKRFSCEKPLLKSIDCTIILTMANSQRLVSTINDLIKLSRTTFIQENKGYTGCKKEDWVDSSSKDLVHAYVQACKFVKHIKGYVLILEDDAQIIQNKSRLTHFRRVNTFITKRKAKLYTLGSFGMMTPNSTSLFHNRMHFLSFTQAIIWSKRARDTLLKANHCSITHIDSSFCRKIGSTYTYYRPLIIQTFPNTVNRSSWCLMCNEKYKTLDAMFNLLSAKLIHMLQLDVNLRGWSILNTMSILSLPTILGVLTLGLSVLKIKQRIINTFTQPIRF